jgi:hypothetical protein
VDVTDASEETAIVVKTDDNKEDDLTKPALVINSTEELPEGDLENNATSLKPSDNIIPASLKIATETVAPLKAIPITTEVTTSPKTSISFSNNDSVMNYNTKESPTKITTASSAMVSAPKTLDRLEKISHERNEQRKLEEEEEDDDDDDFNLEKIKIFDNSPKLDALDIQVLDGQLKLEDKPILEGVEVLS